MCVPGGNEASVEQACDANCLCFLRRSLNSGIFKPDNLEPGTTILMVLCEENEEEAWKQTEAETDFDSTNNDDTADADLKLCRLLEIDRCQINKTCQKPRSGRFALALIAVERYLLLHHRINE